MKLGMVLSRGRGDEFIELDGEFELAADEADERCECEAIA
jgi:hypothetical protein